MIVNSNGKILTVVDAPAEGDAFAHQYWWDFETMYLKSDCGVTAASQPSELVGSSANLDSRSNSCVPPCSKARRGWLQTSLR